MVLPFCMCRTPSGVVMVASMSDSLSTPPVPGRLLSLGLRETVVRYYFD